MPHSKFGWDLPPGCRVSDIPGNRPEDMRWEAIINGFWDKKRTESKDKMLADANSELVELIDEAIEYGMDIGGREERALAEENKGWKRMYQEEYRNLKLRAFFKALRDKAKLAERR